MLDPSWNPELGPTEDDRTGDDSDEHLIALCFQERGLRLDIDTVRGWDADRWEAARDWIEGGGAKPAVILEAEAEYAAARKCRVCGCTDNFACPEGCTWTAYDLCSACAGGGN